MSEDLFGPGQELPAAASLKATGNTPNGPLPEYDEEAVTPEEQAQYDQFVLRAQEFLTKEPGVVIDYLNNKNRPVFENVGRAALMVAEQVSGTARQRGVELSPEVMMAGGEEIVGMLMEMGDAAKIFPFKQKDKEYDEVMAMGYMHAAELAGKQMLQSPDADRYSMEAQAVLGQQIAAEEERGEVDPRFWQGLQNQLKMKSQPS